MTDPKFSNQGWKEERKGAKKGGQEGGENGERKGKMKRVRRKVNLVPWRSLLSFINAVSGKSRHRPSLEQ